MIVARIFALWLALAGLVLSAAAQQQLIQEIVIHGNRRIPAETLRARIFSRPGDVYDEASLQRDFASLWNTGYFEDLRIEREESAKGYRIHVYVKEKPTIRTLDYKNLNAISQSDVLERFKKAKVGLTVESQYDPTKIKKAEVVLKDLLAEHGHQFATIRTEVRPIPPAAVGVTFVVKEGPKVKVGRIKFEGNKKLSATELRAAMKNLKPYGIPRSIFLENLIAKTYDASKLNEDTERVRDAYQQKGYFKALVADPKTDIRNTGAGLLRVPFTKHGGGKSVDITIPVEEGARFKLGGITFTGSKAVTNTKALRGLFPMKDGDWVNVASVRKGLDNLRKAYGELGYINFTPVPDTQIDDEKKIINVKIDLDEGKPYFVRRIEFTGNTTTRDKVIRRELALEEGNVYNSRLWEFSLLRLNQLGYFEALKPEQDSEIKKEDKQATVDINLKVKEKGKNSIGLTGGLSGQAGAFVGINYETNNFLGLGETLSVVANVGNLSRNVSFGFTQPYLFDRPLQFGFSVFNSKIDYNQAKTLALQTGTQVNLPQNVLDTLQNFNQSSTGFTTSLSYPLRRSLKRVGVTYSLDRTSIQTFSQASTDYFSFLAFRQVSGPNALQGIITSKLVPSFSVSTIDSPNRPHTGRSLFVGGEVSGLGGNVSYFRPIFEFKQFIPVNKGRNTLGVRFQGTFVTGFAGRAAPPFERFYIGGDNDLRGFDLRFITPYAYLPDKFDFPLTNPDGTGVPKDPSNPRRGNITVPIPIQRIVATGGDTSMVSNVEYRIPIVGPVTLAAFTDFGMDFIARQSQLKITNTQLRNLNSQAFGCTGIDAAFNCISGGGPLTFTPTLRPVAGTNYTPRMSSGLELQVILPVVNAPFRVYYAYNPLILNTVSSTPNQITRGMFPAGGAGDFSFQSALSVFAPTNILKEPRKTFRFTVSTTF